MNVIRSVFKDPLGAFGLIVIAFAAIVGIGAYLLIPDKSTHANEMHLALANLSPGSEVKFITQKELNHENIWQRFWSGEGSPARAIPVGTVKETKPQLVYRDYPLLEGPEKSLVKAGPSNYQIEIRRYWLGTDRFGRDMLSRLILGSRVSLSVGFLAVFISLLIGIPLGSAAAYYGGWTDKVIQWLINVTWSIPGLLLVIAITLALGKGFWQVFVAIGFTMWVEVARVTRGQILGIKEKEYVQAARVLGFSDWRIIWRHILPNAMPPLIVISAANFAAAILIESGLSFLGVGAQPPMPTWGTMIKDHYSFLLVGKAYLAIIPGLAIMLLVLAFMLVGNALRDVLDVRKA